MNERELRRQPDPCVALLGELAPALVLVRPLGEGAVARVFLAREAELGRLVAVKVLRPELAHDEVTRLRFEREAKANARIRHPNVAVIHRVGRFSEGIPYIVMEYVEGRTLADLLHARGPLEVPEARRVLASLAHALTAAHRKGVVHRDVRPGNVVCEAETGRVVLLDFGIAAILDTDAVAVTRLTMPGQTPGNPLYMSPEQLLGQPVSEQSDVYGLGLLAYELLTGASPFAASSGVDLTASGQRSDPVPLERLRTDVDPTLAELVRRCLRPQPAQRPTAAEVAESLLRAPIAPGDSDRQLPARTDGGVLDALGVREFGRELRRRKVYKLSVAYVASVFVLLQAVQLVLPALPLPNADGWYPTIAAIALAGFPLVLLLGWIFDLTPHGLRRSASLAPAPARRRMRRLVLPLAGLAVSVMLAFLGWRLLTG